MIIRLEQDTTKREIEVDIVYPQMNAAVRKIEAAVRSAEKTLPGLDEENQTQFVKAIDILYLESVEKRLFIYTADAVYRSEQTLIFMEEALFGLNFVRVSKSCLLNLNHLVGVRPIFNAKMEATLSNAEKINISRKFVPDLKRKLEEM